MNKKGSVERLMLEIAYISFAAIIGLAVLYFVNIRTNDTFFEVNVYVQDLSQTLTQMQQSEASNIKIDYKIPEEYKVKIENNQIKINYDNKEFKSNFQKKENTEFKLSQKEGLLIIEKNEKIV